MRSQGFLPIGWLAELGFGVEPFGVAPFGVAPEPDRALPEPTIAVKLWGCERFVWGPEDDVLWLTTTVTPQEEEAMVAAIEEDGWGAWVG